MFKIGWLQIIGVVAVIAALTGLYTWGRHDGKRVEKDRWTLAIANEREAAVKAKDAIQADADKKAAEYETERAKDQVNIADAKRRLQSEKAKNSAYATCHAGPEFLRIYEQAAGRTGAGANGETPR